ncbi:MAG: 3-hydroxyacyl-ACP dehydratase FabZ [Chloroflexota bacterium]
MLESADIQKLIPHRYPILLVDRVLELELGQRIVAIKNVSGNEPFFQGHFPGNPIMPGVLIVEALAQAGVILLLSDDANKGKLPLFAGIDNLKFRRKVLPGDTLRLELNVISQRGPVGRGHVRASVDDQLAAEGDLKFVMVDAATT